jgi:hypothetical protein
MVDGRFRYSSASANELMKSYEQRSRKPRSIIPYRIKVGLFADVPVFGKLISPLEKEGEIPVLYKPGVDLDKVESDSFSFEEISATLHMKLENKDDFDLGSNALEYELWLVGMSIVNAKSKFAKAQREMEL